MTGRHVRGSWPAVPASVQAARHLIRAHLRDAGRHDLLDSAELLVSELVGNVVLHVGGTVDVLAAIEGDDMLLEVTDHSVVTPQMRAYSASAGTGRGMRLVHSLSAEHGVRLAGASKTIWVRLTSATATRDDDDLAAEFAAVDWLAELDLPTDLGTSATGRVATAGLLVA